ncbi:hypothetical protein N0V86_008288 [Didymella sp. IMI 355093]|nr:hypothetical protein N0V86_008288 [Didymella sp. IMI 355093]
MGICASCLGGRADDDPEDASQLLGDSYQPQYGTLESRPQHPVQPDPAELIREREALEQICAETSSQLITVMQLTAPPDSDQPHVSETTDYAQHFSKRFPSLRGLRRDAAASADADMDESAWLDSVLGGDEHGEEPVKAVQGGLTRQFGK